MTLETVQLVGPSKLIYIMYYQRNFPKTIVLVCFILGISSASLEARSVECRLGSHISVVKERASRPPNKIFPGRICSKSIGVRHPKICDRTRASACVERYVTHDEHIKFCMRAAVEP